MSAGLFTLSRWYIWHEHPTDSHAEQRRKINERHSVDVSTITIIVNKHNNAHLAINKCTSTWKRPSWQKERSVHYRKPPTMYMNVLLHVHLYFPCHTHTFHVVSTIFVRFFWIDRSRSWFNAVFGHRLSSTKGRIVVWALNRSPVTRHRLLGSSKQTNRGWRHWSTFPRADS